MLRLIAFARRTGAVCLEIDHAAAAERGALHLRGVSEDTLRSLHSLMAMQVLAAELSATRGIDTSRRRYPDFFSLMGSKMEEVRD